MLFENFENALSKMREKYEIEKAEDGKVCFAIEKKFISDFEIDLKILFVDRVLDSVIVSESRFLKKNIKSFIVEKVLKDFYNFTMLSSTEFLFNHIDSLKKAESNKAIMQYLSSTMGITVNFLENIKNEYELYILNSRKWVEENMQNGQLAFFDIWNIPTDGSFINLTPERYSKIIDSSQEINNFEEISMISLPKNDEIKSIIAMIHLDSVRSNAYVQDFNSKANFKDVVCDINKKLMKIFK